MASNATIVEVTKENLPPSYDEVMSQMQIGANTNNSTNIYSNAHNIQPTAPPPYLQPGYMPTYGAFETTPVSVETAPQPAASIVTTQHTVIFVGNQCPVCRNGVLENTYSALGICLAIFCFPVGILCCLALRENRCNNCDAVY